MEQEPTIQAGSSEAIVREFVLAPFLAAYKAHCQASEEMAVRAFQAMMEKLWPEDKLIVDAQVRLAVQSLRAVVTKELERSGLHERRAKHQE